MSKSVLIIGNGIVGHNLREEFRELHPEVFDKFKPEENTSTSDYHDFAFICVPTDYKGEENPCDITEVRNAILENDAGIYVIKSTVLPGANELFSLLNIMAERYMRITMSSILRFWVESEATVLRSFSCFKVPMMEGINFTL